MQVTRGKRSHYPEPPGVIRGEEIGGEEKRVCRGHINHVTVGGPNLIINKVGFKKRENRRGNGAGWWSYSRGRIVEDAMPGADAVLVMVHAGRDNASAIDQLLSVATSRGQFSWKRDKQSEGDWEGRILKQKGCRGCGGETAHRGSGGCCRPTALKLVIRRNRRCTPVGSRRRKRRI